MMVRTMTMTSKGVNVAMKMIWRKKKVMNVKVQHAHNAALRPLIIKTINAKIMIIEIMIKT
jgi:hypothetical protein